MMHPHQSRQHLQSLFWVHIQNDNLTKLFFIVKHIQSELFGTHTKKLYIFSKRYKEKKGVPAVLIIESL